MIEKKWRRGGSLGNQIVLVDVEVIYYISIKVLGIY